MMFCIGRGNLECLKRLENGDTHFQCIDDNLRGIKSDLDNGIKAEVARHGVTIGIMMVMHKWQLAIALIALTAILGFGAWAVRWTIQTQSALRANGMVHYEADK